MTEQASKFRHKKTSLKAGFQKQELTKIVLT